VIKTKEKKMESLERVINVQDVVKTYPACGHGRHARPEVQALRGVSLAVQRGEIFGIIGENGAGKSTLSECMTGIQKSDSGTISILDINPADTSAASRRALHNKIGVQLQQTKFPDKIRVGEMCALYEGLYEKPAPYEKLLDEFGLQQKRNMPVTALSGGQKQRLAVVLALIPQPELLFLDELTTGLDPKARHAVWNVIKSLQEHGMTILLTSHFMDEVEYLCTSIAVMKRGMICAEGSPSSLTAEHHSKNLEEFFLTYMEKDNEDKSINKFGDEA
jgi:ABC-2 type transport system ATP-binding protein